MTVHDVERLTLPAVDVDRERALRAVHARLLEQRGERAVVASHRFGEGCLVLGLAGDLTRGAAARLRRMLTDRHDECSRALVVTLTHVDSWDPHLARVLGWARIRHLAAGGTVELHDAPPDLLQALGNATATCYEVTDDRR
jgi:MFS superfamily sulfate permease-like transporter